MNAKLEKIARKYSDVSHNADNYEIGGGLDSCKFASRRHEDARSDAGKLTLGEANSLFAKATGLTTAEVKELIEFQFSDLEWHHAGKLPKSYGGQMKKTYFLNATQIVEFAENFEKIKAEFEADRMKKIDYATAQRALEARRREYLNDNATKVVRVPRTQLAGSLYITIRCEMSGKYGWFEAQSRYNLTEYITAWVFDTEEKYREYFKIC